MAIVKSTLLTTASGSIAGATFAHSRGALTVRGRGGMTNPNSAAQQTARSALNAAVQAWNALTAAQRAAWNAYASSTPTTNRVGDTIYLSGQNMFCRQYQLNTYLDGVVNAAGGTPPLYAVSDAPTVFNTGETPGSVTSITVLAGVLSPVLSIPVDANASNRLVVYQIGPAQNAGKTFFKGPYTLAAIEDQQPQADPTAGAFTYATASEWLTAYQPAVGDRLPIRVRCIYDDGRVSQPFQSVVEVV